MTRKIKFTIELIPPKDLNETRSFCNKISHLLKYTQTFSLPSHKSSTMFGYDRSVRVVYELKRLEPNIEVLFHVTCHDINRENIETRLLLLKELKVRKLLILTGEKYTMDDSKVQYKDSSELVEEIGNKYADWFELVAVACYPKKRSFIEDGNTPECNRILEKVKSIDNGKTAFYTQCLFDSSEFDDFNTKLRKILSRRNLANEVLVVPSIALFEDEASMRKVLKLTRVESNLNLSTTSGNPEQSFPDRSSLIEWFEKLCNELLHIQSLSKNPMHLNICTFGQFSFAEEIINRLVNPT